MGPLGGAAQGPEGRHAATEHSGRVDRAGRGRTGRRHHRTGRDPGTDADRERITIARARDHSAAPSSSVIGKRFPIGYMSAGTGPSNPTSAIVERMATVSASARVWH